MDEVAGRPVHLVTMAPHVNTIDMLKDAIARDVAFVPGKSFYPDPKEGFNTMRLNFSHPSDEKIAIGIERLGQVMTEWTARKPVAAGTR